MAAIQHKPLRDTAEFKSGEYSFLAAMQPSLSCKIFPQDPNVMFLYDG